MYCTSGLFEGPPITGRLDRQRVIEVDSHMTEPADVWTEGVSSKPWGDDRVLPFRRLGPQDLGFCADTPIGAAGAPSATGLSGVG